MQLTLQYTSDNSGTSLSLGCCQYSWDGQTSWTKEMGQLIPCLSVPIGVIVTCQSCHHPVTVMIHNIYTITVLKGSFQNTF